MKNKWFLGLGKHALIFFAVAGIAVFLPACGKADTVETNAPVQNEEAPGQDGTDAARAQEDAAPEADGSESSEQKDIPEQADTEDSDMEVSPEDVNEAKEMTNAARAQREIEQGIRDELTAELLEENELDTSVMEPGRSTTGCTFELPEGFAESEEMAGMYVTDRYPIDASSIYYMEAEQDKTLQLLTEETFKTQAQESLKEAYGEDITVNVDSFERIRIDGYPAFRILCHYQIGRIQITQLEYAINADKSYMITYSQTSDYDYMEAYEASASTIRVE